MPGGMFIPEGLLLSPHGPHLRAEDIVVGRRPGYIGRPGVFELPRRRGSALQQNHRQLP